MVLDKMFNPAQDGPITMQVMLQETEPRVLVMLGIFFVSLLAVSFPALSKQATFLRLPHLVFFIGKHFGTGVILSTAFCHLLPDAFEALGSRDVRDKYPGVKHWTGAIILCSLLLIFLVEYASTSYVDHLHSSESTTTSPASSPPSSLPPSRPKTPAHLQHTRSFSGSSQGSKSPLKQPTTTQPALLVPAPAPAESLALFDQQVRPNPIPAAVTESTPLLNNNHRNSHHHKKRARSLCSLDQYHRYHHHKTDAVLPLVLYNSPRLLRGGAPQHVGALSMWDPRDVRCACRMAYEQAGVEPDSALSDEDEEDVQHVEQQKPRVGRKRQVIGILILQLGIMIHSLVIGLTLSVTTGSDFSTLVTAIVFHQLFEGLSLGIRISSVPPPPPSAAEIALSPDPESIHDAPRKRPWNWLPPTLYGLFAITTPLGIVLGMFVFTRIGSSRREQAQMQLIQGLMSGISAGMLIYAATVEMLAGDFVFGDVSGDHGHGHHEHGHHHELPSEEESGSENCQTGASSTLGKPDHDIHEHEHHEDHGTRAWKKVLAVVSLLSGAVAMALVGE